MLTRVSISSGVIILKQKNLSAVWEVNILRAPFTLILSGGANLEASLKQLSVIENKNHTANSHQPHCGF